jgi:aminoglycoside phosphotransferase (APT) family kinase protein
MMVTAPACVRLDDTATLRPLLQARLADHFGRSRAIEAIDRRFCPYSSSFRLDELDVRLSDGSTVALMVKDLSPESMSECARRVRPPFMLEPTREISAYRWLLPHAPAGTAAVYGAVSDAAAGRHWLFLERVPGSQLSQVGTFATWERAAAWIARFHTSFATDDVASLAGRTGSVAYGEDFYWCWMERARCFARRHAVNHRDIDALARRYERVVKRLARLPRTLIHGEFFACNVVVDPGGVVPRVCPVDWEMSAVGPGLIDLAALAAGWAEPRQRALARAYLAATRQGDAEADAPPMRLTREFLGDFDRCRFYLSVRMLGWSDDWQPPRAHQQDWLAQASQIAARLPD